MPEPGRHDILPGGGDDDIEQQVGFGGGKHGGKVGADGDAGQAKGTLQRRGGGQVDIDEAHQFDAAHQGGLLGQGLDPTARHGTASRQHRAKGHQHSPHCR